MKQLSYIMLLLFIPTCMLAQSRKDIEKRKVKSQTEFTINYQNHLEKPCVNFIRKFDKNGNTIEETEFDKMGKFKRRTICHYKNKKDKIDEFILDSNGKQVQHETYTYNSDGEKIEEKHFNGNNELEEVSKYSYNAKGLKSQKQTFDNRGQVIRLKKYNYEY